ncbi:MAG: rhomboid family intramembrane serine protease [Boseongicola sp.]|nr:MAG: rhomboid family intramembrane serine protease [Boseongicola sp.]
MSDNNPQMQPVFNTLPSSVVVLALAIFAVEVLFSLGTRGIVGGPGAVGWRLEAWTEFGFFAPLLEQMVDRQEWFTSELKRFVTYPFVHLSFTHTVFVAVFLLALGKLVGEVMGNITVLVVFFASSIFGALIYAGLTGDSRPLVGGYPGVYGLIGAYSFILWVTLGTRGQSQWQAFSLIGILMSIQLLFGLLFGAGNDWVAEFSGFLMGFAISPILVPGGFSRLLNKMRQR